MTRRTRGLACHTSTEQTITKTPSQKAKPALPLLQPPQNIPLPPNRSQRRRPLPTPPNVSLFLAMPYLGATCIVVLSE